MNALLNLVVEAVSAVLRWASGFAHAGVIDRLASDPSYRNGFFWGFATAATIGFIYRQWRYWQGKIRDLFKPSEEPVNKGGPSKFGKAVSTTREFSMSCGTLVIVVLIVAVCLVVAFLAVSQHLG